MQKRIFLIKGEIKGSKFIFAGGGREFGQTL
jgi:hypothetical protein